MHESEASKRYESMHQCLEEGRWYTLYQITKSCRGLSSFGLKHWSLATVLQITKCSWFMLFKKKLKMFFHPQTNPYKVKLHNLEWYFTVGTVSHTCVWHATPEENGLTQKNSQTDWDRFVNNIWNKSVHILKVLNVWVHENIILAFIFFFRVYLVKRTDLKINHKPWSACLKPSWVHSIAHWLIGHDKDSHCQLWDNDAEEEMLIIAEILHRAPTIECLCCVYTFCALMSEMLHKYLFSNFNVC